MSGFPGHFDDDPNVPGFVQIESLVQTFIMTFLCMDEYKGMKTNFVSVNNTRFKKDCARRCFNSGRKIDLLQEGYCDGFGGWIC